MLILPHGFEPERLFAPAARYRTIGLAVSGGADSLGLMALAAQWQAHASDRFEMIVYTLDHGLRPEAQNEARRVADYATTLGLECRILVWKGEKPVTGLQAAARAARYRLIGAAMAEDGTEILMTAHHQGDQAETVLMRMAHGSGVAGLGGMRSFSDVEGVSVFRPLLECSGAMLADVVAQMGWQAVDDPSNRDAAYERVRWRQVLADHLAPMGLDIRRLGVLAERMQRIDRFAQDVSKVFWGAHVGIDAFGIVTLSRVALAEAQPEIVVRVLERAVGWAGGGGAISLGAIEDMAKAISAGVRETRTLSGAQIMLERERIAIFREAGRFDIAPVDLVCGQSLVWDKRFVVTSAAGGLSVEKAVGLTRACYERLLGEPADALLVGMHAAPLVRNGQGEIVALGCKIFVPGVVDVQLTLT